MSIQFKRFKGTNKQNILKDLSLITGAVIINEDLGDDMDMLTEDHLGKCKRAITNNAETILQVSNVSEQTEEVIKELKEMQDTFQPTYENKADYDQIAEETAKRIKSK